MTIIVNQSVNLESALVPEQTTPLSHDPTALGEHDISQSSQLFCEKRPTPTTILQKHTLHSWVCRELLSPAALTRLLRAERGQWTSYPLLL